MRERLSFFPDKTLKGILKIMEGFFNSFPKWKQKECFCLLLNRYFPHNPVGRLWNCSWSLPSNSQFKDSCLWDSERNYEKCFAICKQTIESFVLWLQVKNFEHKIFMLMEKSKKLHWPQRREAESRILIRWCMVI